MKITIYELLGLIKDGKAPKKIKYRGKIYIYRNNDGNLIYQYEDSNSVLTIQCFEKLNDEIEILEEVEDKEYEDIEELEYRYKHDTTIINIYDTEWGIDAPEQILIDKINALIRNQKKILERIKNEKDINK